MPTGYTAAIAYDISFEDFVMRCARAMGACIDMKEDSLVTPIPKKFEVSSYYSNKLTEAKKELKRLEQISIEKAEVEVQKERNKILQYNKKQITKRNQLRDKYLAMRRKVRQWRPPTLDHQNLKDFMIKQIDDSIEWDCDTSYYFKELPILTGIQWLEERKKSILKDIDYCVKKKTNEKERVEGRNNWITELRESL